MEKLTKLYGWLKKEGVSLFGQPFHFSNPETKSATIFLKEVEKCGLFIDSSKIESVAEEKSTIAHECGHYATGATHSVSSPLDLIEKHETKADKWAVEHLISMEELTTAIANGYTEIWSLAEHFGVTENFMKKAVCWYIYGNLNVDSYFPK